MSRRPQTSTAAVSNPCGEQPERSGGPDKTADLCSEWLAWHAEHEQLSIRWQTLETHLVRHHRWFQLTEKERCDRPEAAELHAMEEELNVLSDSKLQRLRELPDVPAATAQGMVLKLAVAAATVLPDENKEAHLLLRSLLDDLKAMSGLRTDILGSE